LNYFRTFPYINDGFKLEKIIDNDKSWLANDNKLRTSTQGNYNAYYYLDNEKLVMNVKNVDLFLNAAQGLVYDVWNQSRLYDYPIPESGLTAYYPVPGGVDSTFINPEPKKKTFFEFYHTFWKNMINTRNRQFITDGKTGGYPTLHSVWWNYIQQYENTGIQNNQYTYQKLIDYINGMGPYWMKLVEQMIPATTIWQSGTKFENSVLHRQKFVYRRNRGCLVEPKLAKPCSIVTSLNNYSQSTEYINLNIFPWLNGNTTYTNFNGVLTQAVNNAISPTYTIQTCNGANSLSSTWYIDLSIGNNRIIHKPFYYGTGLNNSPSNGDWRAALILALPTLLNYNLNYNISGNQLTITNLGTQPLNLNQTLTLSVGININITC
jgi:hypothetical protein